MKLWLLLLLTTCIFNNWIQECSSAKILIYIPLPFYSHQVAYRQLWKKLADSGHQITLLTLDPMESHENVTQIDMSGLYKVLEASDYYSTLSTGDQNFLNVYHFFASMLEIGDLELSYGEVKELVNGNEHFDLVITEFYMTLGAAFAHKYNCPLIGVVSMDAEVSLHSLMGNPNHPILYPAQNLGLLGNLDFKGRFISTAYFVLMSLFIEYLRYRQDIVIKKHFGNDMPGLSELEKNISVLFINLNPVFYPTRPLNRHTINVGGGLHLEQPKPLPKDLKDFLDSSEEGVIYCSLGSSIRSSQLSIKTKLVMIKTFSQLPYQILWKYEQQEKDNFTFPRNVQIFKWVPQQDVLRHPNIKLFISQGGLQSLEETLFSGVPVLVMPFFGDQLGNAKKVVDRGFGLSLDHKTLKVDEFKSTILEIVESARYRESAMRLGKQLLDKPMTSVDLAAWWTEYVLRNRNNNYILKPSRQDIPLYQYYFLDIILCCLCLCFILVYFVNIILRIAIHITIYLLRAACKLKKD